MQEKDIGNNSRAEILIKTLPYIQRYRGKTLVVKYGGNAMISDNLKAAVIQDVLFMSCLGIRVALVHGGGPEIEAVLKAQGKESRFVKGLRYTDAETMEIVQMVLCGKVNKDIVSLIQQGGGQAIGVCGIDGGLLQARRLTGGEDLGLVGDIETVKTAVLENILDSGAIPVISPVAMGVGPDAGGALNVNADIGAAKIAGALKAEKLILMTDVRGILRDLENPDSLIKTISKYDLENLKQEGVVSKGMIPKTDCCTLALDSGVKKAHIIDGRLPHALLIELFTDAGIGTVIE
ncbi:MAG: acetylglutamate kinase [Spirochaetaceae bacterium]|jgi:acetylglutamate kinase|nr:acetylglutamate kinase [Spirochaetaceae bacterium]